MDNKQIALYYREGMPMHMLSEMVGLSNRAIQTRMFRRGIKRDEKIDHETKREMLNRIVAWIPTLTRNPEFTTFEVVEYAGKYYTPRSVIKILSSIKGVQYLGNSKWRVKDDRFNHRQY